MRKLLFLIGLLAMAPALAANEPFNTFVSGLSAASSLAGSELFPCIQSGVSKSCTPAQLKTYLALPTINAAAQYATPYYSATGSSTTLSGLTSPTTGPGYFEYRYDPTSTTAVAPTLDQVGASARSISGATSTDTALYSDVLGVVLHDKAGSSAVTETLPTPTSLGNSHFSYNYCNDSAQTDTISPTTWTIALNGGAAASTASVLSGQCATVTVDPFNASQWDAFTYGASTGGSSTSKQAIGWNPGAIGTATTTYTVPGNIGSLGLNALAPLAGTFKNLYIYETTSPASGQTDTFTLYVGTAGNPSATLLSCQIASGANSCHDITDTAAITAGEGWNLQIVTSANAGSTGAISIGVELDH